MFRRQVLRQFTRPLGLPRITHAPSHQRFAIRAHSAISRMVGCPKVPLMDIFGGITSCEDVSTILNKAGIENLLWGSHLLSVYGVPALPQELCFAVPNSQIRDAVACIESYQFPLCRETTSPMNIERDTRWNHSFMNPPAHFHPVLGGVEVEDSLQIFTMEDVLWELPVGKGTTFTDGACNNIMFANDPSLPVTSELQGIGRFPSPQTSVRIPTWQRYVEALMLNAFTSHKLCDSDAGWTGELCYMVPFGDPEKLSDPAFRRYFNAVFRTRDYGISFKHLFEETLEALSPRLLSSRPLTSLDCHTSSNNTGSR